MFSLKSVVKGSKAAGLGLIVLLVVRELGWSQETAQPPIDEEIAKQEKIYRSRGAEVPEGYVTNRRLSDYAALLVEGVVGHRERIDQLLAEHAEGWTVARMPAVDRTLLRIGVYELLWVDEIDDPVAITEAVELARSLSTDDSPRFLNGVLGRIADIAEHLRATR